jgi:protein-S-isoprenylcysteine O-methyltransferase Ste14
MRLPVPVIAIPALAVLLYLFVPGVSERPWTPLRIAGAMIAVISYVLLVIAAKQLGESLTARVEARKLVTHGLYSRIRNPIYIFAELMLVGVILTLHLYWLFAVIPVLIAIQAVRAHREAKLLENVFGQAYLDYRKRTWF